MAPQEVELPECWNPLTMGANRSPWRCGDLRMKPIVRMTIWVLAGICLCIAVVGGALIGPYLIRVRHCAASPADGFEADYFLYIPATARRAAAEARPVYLLVQPNNSGITSDDYGVHRRDAWWTGWERQSIADQLGTVLLVPAFPRPATHWRIYSHALDRDSLVTNRPDLQRLDLQLIAMVDHARGQLAGEGIRVEPKILIQGFSASGMFCNRFVALHPDRVLAATIDSPGGWPLVPSARYTGEELPYPAGVSDLEPLVGRQFDATEFLRVPQLYYMGSLDDNDSLDLRDGWDEAPAKQLDRLFGDNPQSRWPRAEAIFRDSGSRATFLLVEGVGHDRKKLQGLSTDFFRSVLNSR